MHLRRTASYRHYEDDASIIRPQYFVKGVFGENIFQALAVCHFPLRDTASNCYP